MNGLNKLAFGLVAALVAPALDPGNAPGRMDVEFTACMPPEKQHGYAAVNGLMIYYEIHGSGGTPLVLLHGGGSTIDTTFGKILPALARSRQVIAFEQQGHGRTADITDRPFTFEQSADDAATLVKHLGIERADYFGFSNG